MNCTLTQTDCFSFGSWRWLRHERVLLRSGSPVRLGSRAREILALLLEEPGALVTNERIASQVWPGTFVVEVALRVHIAHLRRFLREGRTCYIQNVRGVGYQFAAPAPGPRVLPDSLARSRETDLVGRSSAIAAARDLVTQRRFVTLTGAAGVGKSVVAAAAASGLPESTGIEVKVVDLLEITGAAAVSRAIGAALEMELSPPGAASVNGAPQDRRECLLVLDNCDHQLEATARCVERALEVAPRLRLLMTCRKPLGVRDEQVLRLHPLEFPTRRIQLSAAEAARFAAVELFVRRACASADDFELTDANAATVAGICARLDGLPLAIELAALRVHELGLAGLAVPAELLIDLLTRGQRTSPPHHRTLRGLLDRSYGCLSPEEQLALRCMAVFSGAFTIEQAAAVIPDGVLEPGRVRDVVMSLRAASLIEVHADGVSMSYRLCNIQRAYARSRLRAAPEYEQVSRRQALLRFQA